MLKKKIFSILFLIFLFCLVPTLVSAEDIEKQTTTLDLTIQGTEDNLSTKGWKWDADTKTLTLKNANFEAHGTDPCIKFSTGDNITVVFEGENTLVSEKNAVFRGDDVIKTAIDGTETGTLTFKGSNGGTLNLAVTESNSAGGTGNLGNTIFDVHNLNFESGTINSRGGIFSDGIVTINGGNINIDTEDMTDGMSGSVVGIYTMIQVKITGGNVDIKSSDPAIHVTGLQVEDNVQDGIIITGGNISLSTQASNQLVIATGSLKNKNIVIDGGNLTFEGYVYTKQGDIKVNHFDSLNTNNVVNEVFKVGEQPGNEILYGDADYSKVEEAIATANKLNKSDYKDFSAVEAAINAVIRDKNILEQSEVDAMEKAIYDAINTLVYVDADYSKVDEAINEASKLNKDDYKDFSAVEKAIAAVVRGKNFLEQEDVDAMEKAIYDAISSLELKDKIGELDDTPKTGVEDLSNIVVMVAVMALAGIGILSKKQ